VTSNEDESPKANRQQLTNMKGCAIMADLNKLVDQLSALTFWKQPNSKVARREVGRRLPPRR
jgi:hypothetical protein